MLKRLVVENRFELFVNGALLFSQSCYSCGVMAVKPEYGRLIYLRHEGRENLPAVALQNGYILVVPESLYSVVVKLLSQFNGVNSIEAALLCFNHFAEIRS